MKQIFISILMILVFNCGGGGSSSEPTNQTNCEQCAYNSICAAISCEELLVGQSSCDTTDLNALGCINMLEIIHDSNNNSATILYNTDFNISSFTFNIRGIWNITNISYDTDNIPDDFQIQFSKPYVDADQHNFIGINQTGNESMDIPVGCGVLLSLTYDEESSESINPTLTDINFLDQIDGSLNLIDVCPL